ncbi:MULTISPECIES: DUF397 domain-containing protein [Streptomyces]|uniref:DUF397 domain-containing protein n=1 Tax=Streptomyces luteosporeus TaxID=173856 RepID=A0ABN3TU09_9ACTN
MDHYTTGAWQKSTFSGGGQDNSCVEVRHLGAAIALREGDEPELVLLPSRAALGALLGAVKQGGLR